MGSGTCWKTDSDLKNLDAGQGSLLKILVLDTVQALGSKRTAALRTWLSFVEISWHLVAESQGYHWWEIIHWHCCNRSRPSGCSSSSFDLFYLTFFWGLLALLHHQEPNTPARHSPASRRMLVQRVLQRRQITLTWVGRGFLASSAVTFLGTDTLCAQRCARAWSGWGTTPTQCPQDTGVPTRECGEGRGRQQVQPKEWKYLFRIAFKVWLYFKKQYSNGTRRLYILPVLIPTRSFPQRNQETTLLMICSENLHLIIPF